MRLTWKRIAALLLGVLLCALLGPAVAAADEEEPAALEFAVSDWDGPSNDEMFTEYVRGMFYGPSRPRLRSPGSLAETLGEVNYAIEQRLKAQIEAVAAGDRTSTEFVVDVSDLDMTQFDLTKVYGALLVDCTSSLYWHDIRLAVSASSNSPQELVVRFPVAMDYRVSQYEVDSTQIDRAKNAKTNADAILSEYASASDVDKLRGYMYEICKLNVYNDDAAHFHGSDISFGIDPWQLVYVFDGDTDTNVVCEGYSKAFEYLCDNTSFSSSLINTYCVSGEVHMWNIIRMDDGDNYVMDVTWSDSNDSDETDYAMFLSHAVSGSVQGGYKLTFGGGTVVRKYYLDSTSSQANRDMLRMYTEAELTISDHAYAGPHTHTAGEAVTENIVDPTCTQPGSYDEVICCSVCGHEMSRTKKTVAPLGHTAGEAAAENAVDPTCTEAGHHDEVVRCTVCQAELSRTPVTDAPALGHSPGEAVTESIVDPTCTEPGSHDEVSYCTRCGDETGRTTVTDSAMGHAPGQPVRENEVPATYDAPGSYEEVIYCTRCHEPLSRTSRTIPVLIRAPQITTQPANVKAVVNKTATFSVAAQGTGLHYQWYVQTKGSAASAPVGGDSARLTVTAAAALDGARYRCVVTGEGGKTATANEVTLTVVTAPKITAQPKKASVKAGKKVTFKVKASGYDLTYQWYYQKPGAKKWVKIKNAVKPSYSFKAGRSKNGYKYRCYVTNPAGTVKSKTAKLTVK